MKTPNKILAQRLRRELTSSERRLWYCLRNRRLEGAKFRRQQCLGSYVLDFYCPDLKLGIELDGGQHDLPETRRRDTERQRFLTTEGVTTLRFWNSQVRENLPAVLERIKQALVELGFHPSPPPSPPRGEGVAADGKRPDGGSTAAHDARRSVRAFIPTHVSRLPNPFPLPLGERVRVRGRTGEYP